MIAAAIVAGMLALSSGSQQQQMDTTFAVRGSALSLEGFAGSVDVRVWDRAEVRVVATHEARTRIRIRNDSDGVDIEAESRGRPDTPVRYEVTVPRRFSVSLEGVNFPVTVTGVQGDVDVENVEGMIMLRGITGNISAESVMGGVTIEDVRGNVEANTVNQTITLTNMRGDIEAETVNGSIVMRAVDATNASANTINGLVDYSGALKDGGRYEFSAHNGRVTLAVPAESNARISASTHTGKVVTGFTVPAGGMRNGSFSFTTGSGGARVQLESFNGDIHLIRPGAR